MATAIQSSCSAAGQQSSRPVACDYQRSWWKSPILWIALLGFLLRIGSIVVHQTYWLSFLFPTAHHYHGIGAFETGSIARSLARGEGFSSPFSRPATPTGPTSWIAPIYPYICAAMFKLFGVSKKAEILIACLNSLFAAFTAAAIYQIGIRMSGPRLAFWSGFAWSVVPIFWYWATTYIWDTALSALLVTLSVLFALTLQKGACRIKWLGFGIFWGLALLINPALLTVFVISLAWVLYRLRRRGLLTLKPIAIGLFTCAVVISPWLIRNRIVFGQFVFIRGNFGFEFYLGNHAPLAHFDPVSLHPAANPKEFEKYRKMGEVAFVAAKQEEALQFVAQHPRDFLALTAARLLWFWDGSVSAYLRQMSSPPQDLFIFMYFSLISFVGLAFALARRLPAAGLLTAIFMLYPWPYYLTYVQNRYRHPIEPLMLLAAIYFLEETVAAVRMKIRGERMTRPEIGAVHCVNCSPASIGGN